MNADDDFDIRLENLFAAAEPAGERGEAFAARVAGRLRRRQTLRGLLLGAAGSVGALIAASQFEQMADIWRDALARLPGGVPGGGMIGSQGLAAAVMGAVLLGFALAAPERR